MANNLYDELCSHDNLELAFNKARKGKTLKPYVIEFERNLTSNLLQLRNELLFQTYTPKPLETFILRDPKTRKISKSDFRDRVVHHAICNVIEPMFDKTFIYDSYANRIGKGTLNAIKRFDYFKRKVSRNNFRTCFVLKADIKHYFENVDHAILMAILKKKIKDDNLLWLIKRIIDNHKTDVKGKGMPLGNLTSQFFANVYLNELDQFVKHKLRDKYYIRYVDFVILNNTRKILNEYIEQVSGFLKTKLNLELHPDKSKIVELGSGIGLLGFKIFYHHKLIKRKNVNKFNRTFNKLKELYGTGIVDRDKAIECFEGWLAYISHANTYKYRRHLILLFNQHFPSELSIHSSNVKKHENFIKKIEQSALLFSTQKTLQLFRSGLTVNKIAEKRSIKESTVWEHFAKLIEHNQLSVWNIISKDKIYKILPKIHNENDKLKEIKARISDSAITFDEITCVLAYVKSKNQKMKLCFIVNWYQKAYCRRKCSIQQIKECKRKLDYFVSQNSMLKINRSDFLKLFNDYMSICILTEGEKKYGISFAKVII